MDGITEFSTQLALWRTRPHENDAAGSGTRDRRPPVRGRALLRDRPTEFAARAWAELAVTSRDPGAERSLTIAEDDSFPNTAGLVYCRCRLAETHEGERAALNILSRLGVATVVDHPKSNPAFFDVVMSTYDLVKQVGDRQPYLAKKSPWILSLLWPRRWH